MKIHRHELQYFLVSFNASTKIGYLLHVSSKCDGGYWTMAVMNWNSKATADAELRGLVQELTLEF